MLELKETVICNTVIVLLFIVLLGDQIVSTPTHMNTQKLIFRNQSKRSSGTILDARLSKFSEMCEVRCEKCANFPDSQMSDILLKES